MYYPDLGLHNMVVARENRNERASSSLSCFIGRIPTSLLVRFFGPVVISSTFLGQVQRSLAEHLEHDVRVPERVNMCFIIHWEVGRRSQRLADEIPVLCIDPRFSDGSCCRLQGKETRPVCSTRRCYQVNATL